MKKYYVVLAIAIVILGGFVLYSRTRTETSVQPSQENQTSTEPQSQTLETVFPKDKFPQAYLFRFLKTFA
ncbi:MAG: hypothetical protein HY978_04075 [Candidatus Liptonbacteria bacterium]|nr:hypothetical protein [Candidatus Liptonbacteria bacterium]